MQLFPPQAPPHVILITFAMSESESAQVVNLIYDLEKVEGKTERPSTPKKASSISFQQLMSQQAGGEVLDDNAIYVGTESVAYFRVDSPDMLDFILKYHSKNESSTTIVVRAISRASPNTSPLRNSTVVRLTGSAGTPSLFNDVDPLTLERVKDLIPEETVRVREGKVQITVDASSLVQFLQHAERDGKSIFQLQLPASDQYGNKSLVIDSAQHELWFRSLCRGNSGKSFLH